MLKKGIGSLAAILVGVFALSACAMLGDGIPPEKLGEYAIVESHISMQGRNMDTLQDSMRGIDNFAYISWINGKPAFPARQAMNVLPGEYTFQVGIGCNNSATCRPGAPFKLNVKAGSRYVLLPEGVMVSDRFVPREKATEKPY